MKHSKGWNEKMKTSHQTGPNLEITGDFS